jgi:predicted permease
LFPAFLLLSFFASGVPFMLSILVNNILPVFSVLVLGFWLGKIKLVSREEASALNRVAFLALQPPLIFLLLSQVDLSSIHYLAILSYGAGQAVIFTLSFLLCRYVLGHEMMESWLLAMAMIFVNSLLYIWPISTLIYGEAGNIPIVAIVAWDAAITFAFFVISTDLLAHKTASTAVSFKRLAKNPVLLTIIFAIIFNLSGLPLLAPIETALNFLSGATAPATLFALGVILSATRLMPSRTICLLTGIKLFGLPVLVAGLLMAGNWPADWSKLLVLNAAGPAGAMPFAIAMLYGVSTARIAPIIIWTSLLSLFTLAWLA